MSVIEFLKQNWQIRERDLIRCHINPNKDWNDVTVGELGNIAEMLDVQISNLFQN